MSSKLGTIPVGGNPMDIWEPVSFDNSKVTVACCPAGGTNPQPQTFTKGDPQTGNAYLAFVEGLLGNMKVVSLAQMGK